ncbi:MAG: hypothetical protein ABS894_00755 [Aerococcus urinaeequi]
MAYNNRFIIGQMFSAEVQSCIRAEKLEEEIMIDLSRHLASAIKENGKLQVTKEKLDDGRLKCDAELFVFTREELTELIVSVEQDVRKRDQDSWRGMDWG